MTIFFFLRVNKTSPFNGGGKVAGGKGRTNSSTQERQWLIMEFSSTIILL